MWCRIDDFYFKYGKKYPKHVQIESIKRWGESISVEVFPLTDYIHNETFLLIDFLCHYKPMHPMLEYVCICSKCEVQPTTLEIAKLQIDQ